MDLLLLTSVEAFSYQIIPDLGLMYIASSVRNMGMEVVIKDCRKEKWSLGDLERYVAGERPLAVGIKAYSNDLGRVAQMAGAVRRAHPEALILVGGPHPSMDPEGTLALLPDVDFAFQGEAERSMAGFMSWARNGRRGALPEEIHGIAYRGENGAEIRPPVWERDLDTIAFPAWDLMPVESYADEVVGIFAPAFPAAPMILSRGCPYKCAYCGARYVAGNRLRVRSVENIIEEIDFLERKYGVKTFTFSDDSFTSNREQAMELFDALARRPRRIMFTFPNGIRVNSLDAELLKLMEKAGCRLFGLGIESASDSTLARMKKGQTAALIKEKVELTRRLTSIKITGFFILGYPGETLEDVKHTISFASDLPIHHAHFCLFIPLPGAPVYDELVSKGLIVAHARDPERLTLDSVSGSLPGLPPKKLLRLHQYAYLKFYLKPWRLASLPSQIKSMDHIAVITRRIVKLFNQKGGDRIEGA
jgi:radical SAM superfamily enzyme YgiQ (UPF0313 family)